MRAHSRNRVYSSRRAGKQGLGVLLFCLPLLMMIGIFNAFAGACNKPKRKYVKSKPSYTLVSSKTTTTYTRNF